MPSGELKAKTLSKDELLYNFYFHHCCNYSFYASVGGKEHLMYHDGNDADNCEMYYKGIPYISFVCGEY